MKNILVVAAHPDDEVLGVGGTIPLLREAGADVTVLIVTDGSTTQYANDERLLREKQDHVKLANDVLGTTSIIQWQFPDMRLDTLAHAELNKAFEDLLQEGRYDAVFVHDDGDVNLDHQMIYRSVAVAARPYPGQRVQRLYTYYVVSSSEWGRISGRRPFAPNVYVDIGTTIDRKVEAMSKYEAELRDHPHPRSLQAIRDRAAVFGAEVGYAYAEPFKLVLQRDGL